MIEIFLYLIEMIILILLVYEDEMSMHISLYKLILLFFVEILIVLYSGIAINKLTFLVGSLVYFIIFFLTKGIGLGDVILNSILSLKMDNLILYYKFFTSTFCIGAVYSIFLLLKNNYKLKSEIPFIKFIVIGYYIVVLGGVGQWNII